MHISDKAVALIKQFEGLRLSAYVDIAGFRTIGYGHKLTTAETFTTLTEQQADDILIRDVAIAEAVVTRMVRVPLTQGQFDALVDFVFNLGAGRLASSTLLRLLNAAKYDDAAQQLLLWDHSGGHEVAGLRERREIEYQLWTGNHIKEQ